MEKITETHPSSGSQDILADNIQKLKEIFPEVFSEGHVDFEKLQLLLGDLITPKEDLYGLNWWGKNEAIKESMKRSLGTLRPDKESSKNWDTTENLYIEGDNLEVLKLLQKSYNGKVKMIYIDPPYNTGKDFVYKDNYKDNLKNYLTNTGQVDSEGVKQSTNTKDDGRYHSNWLNMMYPRLKLARNLLTEDGVIFISIDDNELHNLKKITDETFGEKNFIGQFNWFKSATPPNLSKKLKKNIEYIVCYEKNRSNNKYKGVNKFSKSDDPLTKSQNSLKVLTFKPGTINIKLDNQIIKKGIYGTETYPNILLDDLEIKDGKNLNEISFKNKFIWLQSNLDEELSKETRININSKSLVLSYKKSEYDAEVPPNFINDIVGVDTTENAGSYLQELTNGLKVFSYPKPVSLVSYLLGFLDLENEIILDFFSGSGTTGEAVFEIGKGNKFILVQIPEVLDEKGASDPSEVQVIKNAISFLEELNKKRNLAELGKERTRRAGDNILKEKKEELEKLKEKTSLVQTEEEKARIHELQETIAKLDIGFKVFKLDSSNIEAWDTEMPETVQGIQTRLEESRNHLKKGRTEEDLLYELLLKQGLLLTSPIEERTIAGTKVYSISHGELFICMNAPISMAVVEGIGTWGKESTAEAIVDLKPVLVLKDEAFANNDAFKTNAELRLKNEFGFAKVNTL
jgi:adenine-specific DNA-methyltransferase